MPPDQPQDGRAGGAAQATRQYPPRMTRSQPQLATAYAPGAIFTWEGGKGSCLSVPIDGAAIDFSARQTRRDQIIESLQEFCQNWLARGMAINRNAPIYEQQLLDACFHNPMRQGQASVDIALDRFEFLRPERMGYLPGYLRAGSRIRLASASNRGATVRPVRGRRGAGRARLPLAAARRCIRPLVRRHRRALAISLHDGSQRGGSKDTALSMRF
jgi:hypothetical protein